VKGRRNVALSTPETQQGRVSTEIEIIQTSEFIQHILREYG
jgi:hypothetical protein